MDGKELANLAELEQDRMMEVIKYQSEGRSKSWIKQKTGIGYQEQDRMRREFADYVNTDSYMRYRAREAAGQIDQHYNQILEKFYNAHDDAVANDDYKTSASILRDIAGTEKQRIDFLHRAGMLGEQNIGDNIAEAEQKIDAIKNVLKEVAREHPEVRKSISEKLAALDGTVVASKVVGEEKEIE